MSTDVLSVSLPWPPTVNHQYRPRVLYKKGVRIIGARGLTTEAKDWKSTAVDTIVLVARAVRWRPTTPDFRVQLDEYPPDNRPRDLDNVVKLTLDSLAAALSINDTAIIEMVVRKWAADRTDPRIEVLFAPCVRDAWDRVPGPVVVV